MRTTTVERKTRETDIRLTLCLDGSGKTQIDTGIGFLDHMLELFARHGRFDLTLKCVGDLQVDCHHSVEDIAICLGKALKDCLGDKRGIVRYGSFLLPMDESLVLCALDLSGRARLVNDLDMTNGRAGQFDGELMEEFLQAFVREGALTLHLKKLAGGNAHHVFEAAFKGMARALRQAVAIDPSAADEIPSTKGVL